MNSSQFAISSSLADSRLPTPITRLLSSRSLPTSGVKSLSPDTMTKVLTCSRLYASSMASTAIWMSARFFAPSRAEGISISPSPAFISSWRASRYRLQSA